MRAVIHLDYQLEDPRDAQARNYAEERETALLFYRFPCRILFRIDGTSFDTPWWWVPLLHFSGQLREIISELREKGSSHLEFTECEHQLQFAVTASGQVRVHFTFTKSATELPLTDLAAAFVAFSDRVLTELPEKFPTLAENPAFAAFAARKGLPRQ